MIGRKDCRQGKSKTYRKWENKTLSPCLPQFSFGAYPSHLHGND